MNKIDIKSDEVHIILDLLETFDKMKRSELIDKSGFSRKTVLSCLRTLNRHNMIRKIADLYDMRRVYYTLAY